MGGTFNLVPQLRLEFSARIERHRFSQQWQLPCDTNWGTNSIKPLKGTLLPMKPTLCWSTYNKLIRHRNVLESFKNINSSIDM